MPMPNRKQFIIGLGKVANEVSNFKGKFALVSPTTAIDSGTNKEAILKFESANKEKLRYIKPLIKEIFDGESMDQFYNSSRFDYDKNGTGPKRAIQWLLTAAKDSRKENAGVATTRQLSKEGVSYLQQNLQQPRNINAFCVGIKGVSQKGYNFTK